MTEPDTHQPDRPDPVSAVRPLLREPASVADAADLDLRLAALADWLKERRDYVRDWLLSTALDRHAEDGAAPTWRLDGATVTLTDPKPKPYVADADAFGRWWAARCGADVDAVEVRPGSVEHATDDVAVRTRVSAPEAALADFAVAMRMVDTDDHDATVGTARRLAASLTVEREIVVADGLLDRLVDTAEVVVAFTEAGGYDVVAGSGELVPGVSVRPPADPTIQLRPSQAVRDRVRRELDDALHPPSTRRPGLD